VALSGKATRERRTDPCGGTSDESGRHTPQDRAYPTSA
jgi:hypothetical protein